jgi:hypothetical protein
MPAMWPPAPLGTSSSWGARVISGMRTERDPDEDVERHVARIADLLVPPDQRVAGLAECGRLPALL